VKYYTWNPEKNKKLKEQRKVSFEHIVFYLEHDGCLDVVEHPNQKKYSGQKLFVMQIENYIFLVPFVETGDQVFLKTIIPSRKATQKYLKRGESND